MEHIRTSFPELEKSYRAEEDWWNDKSATGNYSIVGFVFKPKFKEELQGGTWTDFCDVPPSLWRKFAFQATRKP